MNEVVENEVEESIPLIDRWNRWLLGLLVMELGSVTIIYGLFVFLWGFERFELVPLGEPGQFRGAAIAVLMIEIIVLVVGFFGNLIGTVGTLVLALREPETGRGILGFGHLANLIYVASVAWIFILVLGSFSGLL